MGDRKVRPILSGIMQMTLKNSLPVLNYSTGSGWQTLGFANSAESARRLIKKTVSDHSKSLVESHGFSIWVQRRTDLQIELNGGPEGFIYSIGKNVK